MIIIRNIVALCTISVLSACSSGVLAPINQGVSVVQSEAERANANLRAGTPLERGDDSLIRRSTKVWVPVSKVESPLAPAASAALSREIAVNRRFAGLNEMATYLNQLTGIPVTVAAGAMKASVQTLNSANAEVAANATSASGIPGAIGSAGGSSMGGMPMPIPAPLPPGGLPGAFNPMGNVNSQMATVVYSGKVAGFLDLVAARYGVNWEWEGNGLHIFKTKSQTFRLAALPGDTSFASKVGTQSNNATGSTQGSQASGTSNSELRAGVEFAGLSVWKGIEDSIRTMLSPDGKLVVTASIGTITVEDTPMVLERVSRFVDQQNKSLSRQVVINVRVLSVDLTNSEQYGINWDMVYQNLNRGLGLSLANTADPIVDGSSLALKVLSGSMFDGSKAMIDALSKQGRVSQVTSASLLTINNQPAPIQVGRQTAYLASSTTTIGIGGAGNTVTLQPGQVTTGFSMNMLPHILDSKRLMLQYSGDISTLTGLATVNSGNSSIQTPEIDTRNFLQRTILSSGETLVVTGFEQFSLTGDTQGVGSAQNIALGGRLNAKNNRSVLVVLIQPVVDGGS